MVKNVGSQKGTVVAWDSQTGARVTGDAANITAKINIDDAGLTSTDDENPTEGESGHYAFDLLTAETNGNKLELVPVSSTANVECVGLPAVVYTRPANFSSLSIEADGDLTKVNSLDGHTAQTGDSFVKVDTIHSRQDSMVELFGGDFRLTANALAEAPTESTEVAAIKTVVDRIETDTTAIETKVDVIDGFVDTEIAAIKTVVDTISTNVTTIDDLVDTEVAAIKTVVDRIETDTTSIEAKVDTVDTVVDRIETDTTSIETKVDTVSTNLTTVDDFVDTEIAAIKLVTDKLDDTVEDNAGTFRFTTSALAQAPSTSGSVTISQQPVPESRTWQLRRGSTGALVSGGSIKGIQVGEDVLFAIDFQADMPLGSWVQSVSSIAIQTGTAGGVTFGTAGTSGPQAKVKIAGVTAGSYTIRCKVTYADSLESVEGDVELKVVAA